MDTIKGIRGVYTLCGLAQKADVLWFVSWGMGATARALDSPQGSDRWWFVQIWGANSTPPGIDGNRR